MTTRIDFVVRSDTGSKRGGDDVQVQQYVRGLGSEFSTLVVPFSPGMRLRSGAVVHVLNVDRPFELLETARLAGRRPLVVSPIHHDPRGVRAMRSAEQGRGLRSLVDRLMPDTPRELLAAVIRGRRSVDRGSVPAFGAFVARSIAAAPRLWPRVGRTLDRAAAVALLAEGEGALLRGRSGWSSRNAVLTPNGVPSSDVPHVAWRTRSRDVVMVGRVEPRKRQLETVRLAARRGLSLTVVGALQAPGSRFGRAFLAAVAESDSVAYLGALEPQETLRVIADSKVLLNASWVEVQSLVDLEAASLGCHVIATPAGHSAEWLGASVRTTVDVHDLTALVELAEQTLQADAPPPPAAYNHTWADSTECLIKAYRAVGSSR